VIRQKLIKRYSLIAAAVLIVGIVTFVFFKKDTKNLGDKYLTVPIERGDIRRIVSSTGTLQAVVTVQVGSQVSGRVQEIYADFNSIVKSGQLLAVIDPANFEAQRQRAEAQLATAQATVKNSEANLVNRKAELQSVKANLEVSKVNLQEAERQKIRAEGLFKDGLIPERDLQTAQATYDQCLARISQAEAQINQTEAGIRSAISQQDQAAASVKQAQAELRMAEVNLHYTNIISPIDGVVIERNVDIGQTVAASFQTPTLFLIANDLSRMQLIAQIDEADIGVLSEKAKVDFTVDAFPGQVFQGKITEIRLTSKLPTSSTSGTTQSASSGGTATNVVVYNVIIDVDNPQLKLRPAMTANVSFTVASANNVLRIANSALRYRPSDMSPEEIQKLLVSLSKASPADNRSASMTPSSATSDRVGTAHTALAGERPDFKIGSHKTDAHESPLPSNKPSTSLAVPDHAYKPRGSRVPPAGPGEPRTVMSLSTTDRYGIHGGMKIRFPQAEEIKPVPGVLWILDSNGKPQPRRVKFGITNGKETAVLDGNLKEGDLIVTGEINESDGSSAPRSTSPFRGPFSPAVPAQRRGTGR
jgi:HlyD family secretion protein